MSTRLQIIGKPDGRVNQPAQVLYDNLSMREVLRTWKQSSMHNWRPKPIVVLMQVLSPGDTDPIMSSKILIDTTCEPWTPKPAKNLELTDEQKNLFAVVTRGQYDNIVQQPGIFAGSPASFICNMVPADPSIQPDAITETTQVRFLPMYVELTTATGHMVQEIAGASLHMVDPTKSTANAKISEGVAEASSMQRQLKQQVAQSDNADQRKGSVPIATGTVVNIADRMNKPR